MSDEGVNGSAGVRGPARALGGKRFYAAAAAVAHDGAWRVALDGAPVRTPARNLLALPTRALAEAVASEWAEQREHIRPQTMPLTRLANSVIDAPEGFREAAIRDIAAYAGSDLVFYRADAPERLARLQSEAWEPLLLWAERTFGHRLTTGAGVTPIRQPDGFMRAVERALAVHDAFALAALHSMTTLTGSALIALAHANGAVALDAAWAAAHVDEDWQISIWGQDGEAAARRAGRFAEMRAASQFFFLL